MQSISVFLDISKYVDFRWKNPDVSRTQEVCHVTPIFLGSFLGMLYLCQVSSLEDICDRAAPKKLILNKIRLLTRLWLVLSHLRQHKLRHYFKGTKNKLCCSIKPETKRHFFLGCQSKCNLGKSYEWPRIL